MSFPPRPTSAASITLSGRDRELLIDALVAMRPGDVDATTWETSRRTALRKLRNVRLALTLDAAIRLDYLFETGRRSTRSELLPHLYQAQRGEVARFLTDALDELQHATPIAKLVA